MKPALPAILLMTTMMPLASSAQTAALGEEKNSYTLTGNASLVSDYRFRGLSQTSEQPAVQGGVDFNHESGFYLGTWVSNVSNHQYPGASIEWDIYGGYKFTPIEDVGLDLGLIHVAYPGGKSTSTTTTFASRAGTTTYPDTTELYIGASYQWFSVKYNYSLSSSLFGLDKDTAGIACSVTNAADCYNANQTTRGSGYLDINANFEVADKLTLGFHVGHQTVRNYGNYNYSDYKIGLSKDFPDFTLGAAYQVTDANSSWWYAQSPGQVGSSSRTRIGEGALVLSISKTF